MVNTRATDDRPDDLLRRSGAIEPVRPRPPVAGVPGVPRQRQRIPTLAQLAQLMVNGILTLPRNYRRGMFLDIVV